ncbi:MAG: TraX family protein [bacterium]|nr:TraX family protein [bacterium]
MRGFSRNTLKTLAMFVMFGDHMAVALLYPLAGMTALTVETRETLSLLAYALRTLGRLAFPIFAFFLVEGFFYTRSKSRYARRLFCLACLSEIPFDMAISQGFLVWGSQNTVFTLCLGLLLLIVLEKTQSFWLQMLLVANAMALSELLRLDYGASGILLIALLYFFSGNSREKAVLGGCLWFFQTLRQLGFGALAFVLLYRYDGKKQANGRVARLFYLFYPLHLLLLGGLRLLLFG